MQQASRCPRCGTPNAAGQQFCGGCGARLFGGGQQQQTTRCPTCGTSNVVGQQFCGSCGGRLANSCPYCRAGIDPRARFCPNCGATLGAAAPPPPPPQQPGWGPPQQPGWGPQQPPPGWGPQQPPGWTPPQPGYGPQQPAWAPPAPRKQSSSSRPLLILLLFVIIIALVGFVYWQFSGKASGASGLSGLFGGLFSSSSTGGRGGKDTTAPVITNVKVTPGAVSASINWKTNELASTQVDYWIGSDNITSTPVQQDPTSGKSAGVIDHSVVLTGLKPVTTYNYKTKSKDAAGNEAASQAATFTTLEIPKD